MRAIISICATSLESARWLMSYLEHDRPPMPYTPTPTHDELGQRRAVTELLPLIAADVKQPGIYEQIAKTMASRGGKLRCSTCEHELEIDAGSVAQSLASGWPKCCGADMIFERNNPIFLETDTTNQS